MCQLAVFWHDSWPYFDATVGWFLTRQLAMFHLAVWRIFNTVKSQEPINCWLRLNTKLLLNCRYGQATPIFMLLARLGQTSKADIATTGCSFVCSAIHQFCRFLVSIRCPVRIRRPSPAHPRAVTTKKAGWAPSAQPAVTKSSFLIVYRHDIISEDTCPAEFPNKVFQ